MRPGRWLLALAALVALVLRASPVGHEIPRDVTVQVFVKPEGSTLRLLVRAPLAAMRDIEFPQTSAGFLDVERVEPDLLDAVARWILPTMRILEEGRPIGPPVIAAARVSLPSDRSFTSYHGAVAHLTSAPLPNGVQLPAGQALLDTIVEYPIASERSRFAIQPGCERLGVAVLTVLRFVTPEGIRAFEFHGDPGVVRLDPQWHQAAWHFTKLGFSHILDGADHLLFLVCLVIPFRKLRPLILVVTAFTLAHSITLLSAASGFAPDGLWFPPLVETLIAASIVYVSLENIVSSGTTARRWIVAFGFGLVHGFGFSFALQETMQFAGSHLLTSLLAFNVGVEAGQVFVLMLLVPAMQALFKFGIRERAGTIVLSALVAHTAWHWMTDRWAAFRQFPLPSFDLGTLIVATRVLLLVVGSAAVVWLVRRRMGRLKPAASESRVS